MIILPEGFRMDNHRTSRQSQFGYDREDIVVTFRMPDCNYTSLLSVAWVDFILGYNARLWPFIGHECSFTEMLSYFMYSRGYCSARFDDPYLLYTFFPEDITPGTSPATKVTFPVYCRVCVYSNFKREFDCDSVSVLFFIPRQFCPRSSFLSELV